jgi:hypothetical protein
MRYADTDRWVPRAEPHEPPYYDEEITRAIVAVSRGVANPEQQLVFWNYVMYVTKASDQFQDLSYRPGEKGVLATAFAEGSRWVGATLRKHLRLDVKAKQAAPPPKPTSVAGVRARRKQRAEPKAETAT